MRAEEWLRALDDPLSERLPEAVRWAAYRVVEEALANVQRHAGAARATVELALAADGALRVTVADDDRGLVLERATAAGEGRRGWGSIPSPSE